MKKELKRIARKYNIAPAILEQPGFNTDEYIKNQDREYIAQNARDIDEIFKTK